VTPQETAVVQELTPTAPYKAYDAVDEKLAVEAARDRGGAVMAGLADSLGVELAVVGALKTDGELVLSLFELKSGTRIGTKRGKSVRAMVDELFSSR
jgi:hypothetical protein